MELECTITSNLGINCSASSNGSITIHTESGPIIIRLHQVCRQKRILINSIIEQHVETVPSPTQRNMSEKIFRFTGNSGAEDPGLREGNDTLGILFENGSNNKQPGKSLEPSNPDTDLTKFCENLSAKIWTGWKSKQQKDKKSLEAFLSDGQSLFDHMTFSTPEQWSYKTIVASENFGNIQLPFHKASLATWWNNGSTYGDSAAIARAKKRMVLALEPEYENLTPKLKDTKRRQINRYIIQGNVISQMFHLTPGLVITASDSISTTEYAL